MDGSQSARAPLTATANSVLSGDRRPLTPNSRTLAVAKAQFYDSDAVRLNVQTNRNNYPRRKTKADENEEGGVARRIVGFGLGFEKIFATTSIKLPVTAYTIYTEMHVPSQDQIYSRVFNGLNTMLDLKKWIFEKLWVPSEAYELSYAEPTKCGHGGLSDNLRLLTTDDSEDTKALATTRAAFKQSKGMPGVHSIDCLGVTRLYVRLKCSKCGSLFDSLRHNRRHKTVGAGVAVHEPSVSSCRGFKVEATAQAPKQTSGLDALSEFRERMLVTEFGNGVADGTMVPYEEPAPSRHGIPGKDPHIEGQWYRPDQNKHCLFHTRGYDMVESARGHGKHNEIAHILISCGKEPFKKLDLANNVLAKNGPHTRIAY